MTYCKRCGHRLLFSARALGVGLCGPCRRASRFDPWRWLRWLRKQWHSAGTGTGTIIKLDVFCVEMSDEEHPHHRVGRRYAITLQPLARGERFTLTVSRDEFAMARLSFLSGAPLAMQIRLEHFH